MNTHRLEHERKLNAILRELELYVGQRIDRHSMKKAIIRATGDINRHSHSAWINELEAREYIEVHHPVVAWWNRRPNSQIPVNNTTYYTINRSELARHTHLFEPLTNSNTLTQPSTENTCTLKERSSGTVRQEMASPEPQTVIRDKSSEKTSEQFPL